MTETQGRKGMKLGKIWESTDDNCDVFYLSVPMKQWRGLATKRRLDQQNINKKLTAK